MSNMSTINAEYAADGVYIRNIVYRAIEEGILKKLEEEPLPTASQPTRTPTTTGEKHVAGAKSAGSGETTPQAPARPATQPATLPAAGGTGEETLAFLRNQPVFEIMRTEVLNKPDLLLEFLRQMKRSNPTLLEMISKNPQQFISMLNETGGQSGEGGVGAPGGRSSGERVIHVTQEEKEVIDRGILEMPGEEPLPTASQPSRTPATTGGKHVAGAKSARSGETTPQAPARPATQQATLPAASSTGNQPVFEIMRMEVQKNPASLREFLQLIERSNPTLLRIISQNPQQFISMLNETGGEGGEGGGGAPGGCSSGEGVIHVTQEEKEEVIDRARVTEAYLRQHLELRDTNLFGKEETTEYKDLASKVLLIKEQALKFDMSVNQNLTEESKTQNQDLMRMLNETTAETAVLNYSASTTSPAIDARLDMAGDLIGCMVDSPTSAVFGDTIDEDSCAIYESENAKALLEEDLVDIYNLENHVSTRGIPSQNIEKEYDKICADIKSHSDQIVHVFPAYKLKMKTQIVFVVIAKRKISLDLPWKLEVRIVNQYAAESKSSTNCKDNSPLPTAISRTIGDVIDKNAPQLMQNHSYLSAISASSVISKGYGTSNYRIVAKPCIVLSVLVKHFIPVNEKPFPTMIDGFPVDVRECAVVFCGSSAEDFHDRVKMGCKISSGFLPQKHGTLGGFVEHPEYGLCGITCAHVVLDDKLKFELKEKVNVKENEMDPCKLFQPSFDFQNKNVIGKLVEVIYKEGGKGTAGVDLALFKLEQRLPTEGNFPNYQGANTSIRYVSGNVWGKSGIPSNESEVQKFGFVTGLTYGRIQFDNAAVREISFHSDMKVDTKQFTTTLYKQYHIKSNDEKHEFSKQGDSGALVFIKDLGEENDLRCIGMVEAVLTDGTCAVTPITAILEALHVTQLKSFLPNITWEKIDRRLEEMEDRLKKHISSRTTDAPENAAKARKNPSQ